jgi:hypothetical protein
LLKNCLKPIDIFQLGLLLDKSNGHAFWRQKKTFLSPLKYIPEGKLLLTDIVQYVKYIFYVQYSFPLRPMVFEKIKEKRRTIRRLLHYG